MTPPPSSSLLPPRPFPCQCPIHPPSQPPFSILPLSAPYILPLCPLLHPSFLSFFLAPPLSPLPPLLPDPNLAAPGRTAPHQHQPTNPLPHLLNVNVTTPTRNHVRSEAQAAHHQISRSSLSRGPPSSPQNTVQTRVRGYRPGGTRGVRGGST
eukprot:2249989-Rhodomonas_salina.2